MSSLGPHARRLLELGKDAGEPDVEALARSRTALLRRVGHATAVAAAITTVATTAKAAPIAAAPLAAAPLAAAPLATAPIALSAPLVATSLVAPSLVIKVAATLALVVGVGAATASYQAAAPRERSVATVAAMAPSPPANKPAELHEARTPTTPVSTDTTPTASVVTSTPPVSAGEVAPTAPVAARPMPVATSVAANPVVTPVPAPSLSRDVASLRQAQAALVSGDPRGALQAAERVQPGGPLSDEREGLVVLAGCAMHSPDAREQASKFVERRPQAPLAVRVRAACALGD